jgi:hypothetical protein
LCLLLSLLLLLLLLLLLPPPPLLLLQKLLLVVLRLLLCLDQHLHHLRLPFLLLLLQRAQPLALLLALRLLLCAGARCCRAFSLLARQISFLLPLLLSPLARNLLLLHQKLDHRLCFARCSSSVLDLVFVAPFCEPRDLLQQLMLHHLQFPHLTVIVQRTLAPSLSVCLLRCH